MSQKAITLFLCGDVMTGRGIEQILSCPSDPRLFDGTLLLQWDEEIEP